MKKLYIFLILITISNPLAYSFEWIILNSSNTGLPIDYCTIDHMDKNGNMWLMYDFNSVILHNSTSWVVNDNFFKFYDLNDLYNLNLIMRINTFRIDKDSSYWVGCDKGLVHYKDNNWVVYNSSNSVLPDGSIESLQFDFEGNLWIGSWGGGLSRINKIDNEIINYNQPEIFDPLVRVIKIDRRGRIIVGSSHGLKIFDGTNWEVFDKVDVNLKDFDVVSIAIDTSNVIWLANHKSGLVKYDNGKWTIYNHTNSGLPDDDLRCVAVDSNSNLWVGTQKNGIYSFDGQTWVNNNITNSNLPSNLISNIVVDDQNNKWVEYSGNGLAVFNEDGVVLYNINNSFSDLHPFIYPNPFIDYTNIVITANKEQIKLVIYNLIGQEIEVITDKYYDYGRYEIQYDGKNLLPGIYFIQAIINNRPLEFQNVMLIKN
jgi:ligand-binding sensor domain-containing protein